jgi:hypothetical protein
VSESGWRKRQSAKSIRAVNRCPMWSIATLYAETSGVSNKPDGRMIVQPRSLAETISSIRRMSSSTV